MTEVRRQKTFLLFSSILAAICAWVMSLPLFPSQDGPIHVYYAHVLGSLLHGSATYNSYFFIRTLLPPYAIHYYFLILLMHFSTSVVAEKLFVCLILVVFAYGFRFLAMACGASGHLSSLFILPLVLNWPLGMGFFNYLLSLGLAFWALGYWWRTRSNMNRPAMVMYVAIVFTMTVTHPVPVLLVLSVVCLDLCLRGRSLSGEGRNRFKTQLAVFFCSCSSLLYVLHFTSAQRVRDNLEMPGITRAATALRFLRLSSLALFAGPFWSTYLYRIVLYGILFCSIAVALRALRLAYTSRLAFITSQPWLIVTFVLPVLLIAVPSDMNGSHFFTDRLVIVIWIAALLAAASHSLESLQTQRIVLAIGFIITIGVVVLAQVRIRPIALALASQRMHPFMASPGKSGILLGTPISSGEASLVGQVTYNPFQFNPAYGFADTDTVMLNSPWLDLPILPLATRDTMLNRIYPPAVLDVPHQTFDEILRGSPQQRMLVLSKPDFVLFADGHERDVLSGLIPGLDQWSCSAWLTGFICLKR